MITIKDIAAALNVSSSTVARALADSPHISRTTKDRVVASARDLGYVANSAARVLRGEASTLIGLTIPDIENEVDVRLARAVAEACRAKSYQLVLSITEDDPAEEYNQLLALTSARASGLVMIPTMKPRSETLALVRRMPTVQLIRRVPQLDTDWFMIDEPFGIAEAVEHLIGLGHTRIGYVGGDDSVSSGPGRLEGYRSGMRLTGLQPSPDLVALCSGGVVQAHAACTALVDRARPTAIVCGGNNITIGVLQVMAERGLVPPRDISITAYGDTKWHAIHFPPLTSVALPLRDLALAGSGSLLNRLGQPKPSADAGGMSANAVFRPRLIVRASTAAPTLK